MGDELAIELNGEVRTVPAGHTLADLVRELGLPAPQIAVERNKKIVRRSDYAATVLAAGDRIEIVTFFGGG